MPCLVATMIGCWLSAMRSTANAQPRCRMYKLPTRKAMAANPTAHSAKPASSSHTKYICSETSAARNVHIHFRLLSLVFIFVSVPRSLFPATLTTGLCFLDLYVHLLGCVTLSEGSSRLPRT